MANVPIKDGNSVNKFLKSTGAGSDGDPYIPEHKETNGAAIASSVSSLNTKTPALGQALAAASVPVVLPAAQISALLSESDFDAKTGSLTEAAPATDTASSGLNGRLQRIAQRITSLIALIPAALTGGGNFKVAIQEAVPAGTNNIGDVDVLSVAIPATLYYGRKTISTNGTEEALAGSQAILSGVTIKALATNTNPVFVGNNGLTSSTGFPLAAGEQIFLEVANLATVFVDVTTNGEGVAYIAS